MRKILSLLLICVIMFSQVSCKNESSNGSSKIYYVNTDKTGITPVDYDFKEKDTKKQIDEAIEMLSQNTDDIDYVTTIPSGVKLDHWELNDGALLLYFLGDYDSLDTYTEILVRAAIVKTLVQIENVKTISFYINNQPLTDSNGEAVGTMTADAFIEDFGQETDALLSTNLTLYFASADGMSLVPETRSVYYSSNLSAERLVIEQLLKGPDNKQLLSSIPDATKLNSISITENGVCIVNFDATIESTMSGVTENVTLYSIVNSLTELDSVKQVQILVNGSTPRISNVDVDLSSAISRNEDIINTNIDEEDDFIDLDTYTITDEEMQAPIEE